MQTETELIDSLSNQVGLYPGLNQPSSDLLPWVTSTPSVYLSTAHQILRTDLLSALGPDFGSVDPDNWSATKPYGLHQVVKTLSPIKYYVSIVSNNLNHAVTNATYWRETSLLAEWYRQIEAGAIGKLYRFIKGINTPFVLSRQWIFSSEGSISGALLSKSGRFLGTRWTVKHTDLLTTINRIGLQVTGPITAFPVYLFHSSQVAPVAVAYLTGTTSNRTVWGDLNKSLVLKDGYYITGYFESDLPSQVQVVGAQRGFTVAGCTSCFGTDSVLAATRSKYLDMQAVYVEDVDEPVLSWASEEDVSQQSFGLNYIISAVCDRNELLKDALLYQIASDVLEYFMTSDRVNGVAAELKRSAYSVLYGQKDAVNDIGIAGKLNKSFERLKNALGSTDCCTAEKKKRVLQMVQD